MSLLLTTPQERFLAEDVARIDRSYAMMKKNPWSPLRPHVACTRLHVEIWCIRTRNRYMGIRSIYLHRQRNIDMMSKHFIARLGEAYQNSKQRMKELREEMNELHDADVALTKHPQCLGCVNCGYRCDKHRKMDDAQKYLSQVETTIMIFIYTCEFKFLEEWQKLPGHWPLEIRSHIAEYILPA